MVLIAFYSAVAEAVTTLLSNKAQTGLKTGEVVSFPVKREWVFARRALLLSTVTAPQPSVASCLLQ